MQQFDNNELIAAIRDVLPDGECQSTFDILIEKGEIWDNFSNQYGDKVPHVSKIATFLKTTPRAIMGYNEHIRTACVSFDFMPGDACEIED